MLTRNWLTYFLALVTWLALAPSHASETLKAEHVRISWLAPKQFGPSTNTVGIYFDLDPHWHIYWRNPGDSGVAPKFQFDLPSGSSAQIIWPTPQRLPFGDLTNIGYENAVAFPVEISMPQAPHRAALEISVRLEWLVCKEDCIPGFGTLTLKRPIGATAVWNDIQLKLLNYFRRSTPQPIATAPWHPPQLTRTATGIKALLEPKSKDIRTNDAAPDLIPADGNLIAPQKPRVQKIETGYEYEFSLVPGAAATSTTELLLIDSDRAWAFTNLEIKTGTAATPQESFLLLLLFAFAGGLILNLMPCVFPVISLKFFSLIKTASTLKERLRESLLYTAGVLTTFLALGGLLLFLRAGGDAIGWGFHLQSPWVVFALILLFWLMALNFLGAFEFGTEAMNFAGRMHINSSFGVGILSVFVAAPCTGPFMGSALGAAAILPAASALAIFAGLGLGLASPFLIFALSPRLVKLLPRPGAWMESFKQFMAFPLIATTIWLIWVLGAQLGEIAWLTSTTVMLSTAFSLWLRLHLRPLFLRMAIYAISIVIIGWSFYFIHHLPKVEAQATATQERWAPYDREKITAARQEGRPVFVDFTAAWCITCQVNKKTVLDTAAADALFTKHNTLRIRADWTNYDPLITSALAEFGRNSVPTYIFYPADGSTAQMLPQILTLSMIENMFNQP